MGNDKSDKKVMWHEVYRELAKLLTKIDGEELYSRCMRDEEFLLNHNWAKDLKDKHITNNRTGDDFIVNSFDPMQFFVSFNGFGMKKETRIEKINIYFRLLGSKKDYKNIDFIGCPSPIMIALVANRNPESQEELWDTFYNIMESGKNANIDFKQIKKWYGISIESFTVLLFWIDSKNFLPLDKNTLALFETNNKEIKFRTWKEYKENLIYENTDIYQIISKMAWSCDEKVIQAKKELKKFGITKCPNKSLKIIAIKPLYGCNENFLKGLKENQIYLFDKAYTIDEGMEKVEYNKENDIQLFNQDELQININAIVGKNGTGKSTLIELLLATINNLNIKKSNKECILYIKNLQVELIFEDLHIYKIKIDNKSVHLFKYLENKNWEEIKKLQKKQFFYNILVNYSIHSLDSNKNSWIEAHFDNECSTDIVIEPFREDGNINIQEEEKRVKQRLIVNLLEPENYTEDEYSFRQITETLKAVSFIALGTRKEYESYRKEDMIFDINKISEHINKKIEDNIQKGKQSRTIKSVMPKNFFSDIILSNGVRFSQLSSGEKQKIYSINSIIYHIQEIDRKKKHKHINLILDEIELYFHPELQRTYINDIIKAIKKVGTENILGINITFITHSPFILSDIPKSKILFLDKESNDIDAKTVPQDSGIQTFGANIHTLLSDSFFMDKGLMGEFSKNKIQEIMDFLNNKKKIEEISTKEEHIKQVIESIGESFLKQKLLDMYDKKFIKEYKDRQKEKIKKQIEKLNKQLKELDNDSNK